MLRPKDLEPNPSSMQASQTFKKRSSKCSQGERHRIALKHWLQLLSQTIMLVAARKLHFTNIFLHISALCRPTAPHHHSKNKHFQDQAALAWPQRASCMHVDSWNYTYMENQSRTQVFAWWSPQTFHCWLKKTCLKCQLCKSTDKSLSKCKVSGEKYFYFS